MKEPILGERQKAYKILERGLLRKRQKDLTLMRFYGNKRLYDHLVKALPRASKGVHW